MKKVDHLKERRERDARERQQFELYIENISRVFQSPIYKTIDHGNYSIDPHFHIHITKPNNHLEKYEKLLRDSNYGERYNHFVDMVNLFNGYHSLVDIFPLRNIIEVNCAEVYNNSRKAAKIIERISKREITLRINYDGECNTIPQNNPRRNQNANKLGLLSKLFPWLIK